MATVLGVLAMGALGPTARGGGVAVRETVDGREAPCSQIRVMASDTAYGGCLLDAPAVPFQFEVATALGVLEFARCEVSYRVRVGPRGHTLTEGFRVTGQSPCTDAKACFDGLAGGFGLVDHWRGRIVSGEDGRLEHRVDACLDTCMGHFEGMLAMTLRRHRSGWRAAPGTGAVGRSGWRFAGDRAWLWGQSTGGLFQGSDIGSSIDIEPL